MTIYSRSVIWRTIFKITYSYRLIEDCIEIEQIREDTRLRLIREADEKSKDEDVPPNLFESSDTHNGVVKENNDENPGQQNDADFTGDATD